MKKGTKKGTREKVAIKVIDKKVLRFSVPDVDKLLQTEIEILSKLKHQ